MGFRASAKNSCIISGDGGANGKLAGKVVDWDGRLVPPGMIVRECFRHRRPPGQAVVHRVYQEVHIAKGIVDASRCARVHRQPCVTDQRPTRAKGLAHNVGDCAADEAPFLGCLLQPGAKVRRA